MATDDDVVKFGEVEPEPPPKGKAKVVRWGEVDKLPDPPGPVKIRQFGSGVYQTKVIRPAPAATEDDETLPSKRKPNG